MTTKDVIDQAEKELREEFLDKFAVWNQKYKFAEKPENPKEPFNDPEDWTPPEVADFWLSKFDTYTKDLLQSVVEMAENLKTTGVYKVTDEEEIRVQDPKYTGGYNDALSDIITKLKQ